MYLTVFVGIFLRIVQILGGPPSQHKIPSHLSYTRLAYQKAKILPNLLYYKLYNQQGFKDVNVRQF